MAKRNIADLDYMKINVEDIIEWCKENGEVAWLKAKAAEKTTCKVYPRKTVINADGKKVAVADKSQPYVETERNISFIEIKRAFCDKYFPDKAPKTKDAAPNMYDLIASL